MLENYVDVAARLAMAHQKYDDLRIVEEGYKVVEIAGETFLECVVWVYRDVNDTMPTRGSVTEPFPGKTPFTRNSELMVGLTSALGRALGYMGFGSNRHIASADEVLARTEPDVEITRTNHKTGRTTTVGSRARRPEPAATDNREPEPPPPPADTEPATGRRKEPTEKMMAFLRSLNNERGNPLNGPELGRCAGDFDYCREKIDELQAMPKMS
jgi:hypothetical protein